MQRFPGTLKGISSAVIHNGLVYAVATDPVCAKGIELQTRNTLEDLQRILKEAGSDKTQLIQATVYLDDISQKDAMNDVWCDWIGDESNWPQRACVGVDLVEGYLFEVVVIAALIAE